MKSRVERQQSARTRTAAVSVADGAAGRISPRSRAPHCKQTKHRQLHDEAVKQVSEAAQEIMRANVEKAKAGSLTHTRWLFHLMEALQEEEPTPEDAPRKSLAEILLKQLKNKQ